MQSRTSSLVLLWLSHDLSCRCSQFLDPPGASGTFSNQDVSFFSSCSFDKKFGSCVCFGPVCGDSNRHRGPHAFAAISCLPHESGEVSLCFIPLLEILDYNLKALVLFFWYCVAHITASTSSWVEPWKSSYIVFSNMSVT